MYRDEKDALQARRDALVNEVVEVNARLHAIKQNRHQKSGSFLVVYIGMFCGLILILFGLCMLFSDASSMDKFTFNPYADCIKEYGEYREYGAIWPDPSQREINRTLNSVAFQSCEESVVANDDEINIVFILDTSGSMEPYFEDVKEAMNEYLSNNSDDFFLLVTVSGTDEYETMVLSTDRVETAPIFCQLQANAPTGEEHIPQLMIGAAADLAGDRGIIVAFTDEEPQWSPYWADEMTEGNFCANWSNNVTFAVITISDSVGGWQALGDSCLNIYGVL